MTKLSAAAIAGIDVAIKATDPANVDEARGAEKMLLLLESKGLLIGSSTGRPAVLRSVIRDPKSGLLIGAIEEKVTLRE
jgi:hypothetical protein